MSTVVQMPDRQSPRGRVAAEVRAEMARARVSGNALARIVGKSQAYWSRRITGDVAFDVDDLAIIAGLLGVPIVRFFGGHDEGPRPGGPDGGLGVAAERAREDSNLQPSDPKVGDELGARRVARERRHSAPAEVPQLPGPVELPAAG